MDPKRVMFAKEILEHASRLGVTRGGLQAQIGIAEGTGEIDAEKALNAMRLLAIILEDAETVRDAK